MMKDWLNDRFSRGRTVTRESAVQTPLRLDLRTANGRVTVRGVEGASARVRAEVELKGHQRDDGGPAEEAVRQGIVFEGDSLRIESPSAARDSLTVHYEVSVPFATLAILTVTNGPVDVRGIDGPLELTLTNGPLSVEDIGGAVDVQLTNGPASIKRCRDVVEVKVTNGPIQIEDVAGPVHVTVHNGPIGLEDVHAGIDASATNGPIAYRGAVRGSFDMRSTRGGIVLELPSDSRFELDAEVERGEVYSDFDVKDAAVPPFDEPVPRVRLRADRGKIVVRQSSRVGAAGSGLAPDDGKRAHLCNCSFADCLRLRDGRPVIVEAPKTHDERPDLPDGGTS